MSLCYATSSNLWSIQDLMKQIDGTTLVRQQPLLMGSTIGQHIRHVLEFYECLLDAQDTGFVCYDKRKRRRELEQDASVIGETIRRIMNFVESDIPDRAMTLQISFSPTNDDLESSKSSLFRELAYCLEHTIHHLVIIKMALSVDRPEIKLPENFGVAYSTVRNKAQCAP